MTEPAAVLAQIDRRLVETFGGHRWSPDGGPLAELVSSVLSQRTSHENARRAWDALTTKLPSWDAVADAAEEEIAAAIRAAGLAGQKAPRIKAMLQAIRRRHGTLDLAFLAGLPLDEATAWLRALPGVGPTTAALVLLFGLGRPAMPVDTGIARVARRLGLVPENAGAETIQQTLQRAVSPSRIYGLHLNLIRHSRQICTSRSPECEACPLNDVCAHFNRYVHAPEHALGRAGGAAPAAPSSPLHRPVAQHHR